MPHEHVVAIASAAVDAGLTDIEITMDSEEAPEQTALVRTACRRCVSWQAPSSESGTLRRAADAGAAFVGSPILDPAVAGVLGGPDLVPTGGVVAADVRGVPRGGCHGRRGRLGRVPARGDAAGDHATVGSAGSAFVRATGR